MAQRRQPPPKSPKRADWEALVGRHQRAVLLALLAKGIRIDRAKDLVQETWTKLWERQRFVGFAELELPGLAIRQALFLAAEERRSDRRHLALLSLVPPEGAAVDVEAQALSREQLARLETAVSALAPSAKRVFELVYADGLSHAAVAVEVGLSVQRVRQTLCELRPKLRAALEREEPL